MRIPALPKNQIRVKSEKKEMSWIKLIIARMIKPRFYRLPPRK